MTRFEAGTAQSFKLMYILPPQTQQNKAHKFKKQFECGRVICRIERQLTVGWLRIGQGSADSERPSAAVSGGMVSADATRVEDE